MKSRALLWPWALLAAVACERAERPASRPTPAPFVAMSAPAAASAAPLPDILNRGGLRGLLLAVDDIVDVEVVAWNPDTRNEPLSSAERARFIALVRGGVMVEGATVAHPPWPAAFVLRTRNHGAYAVTLVGRASLRLHSGSRDGRFVGDAARWNGAAPPEMAVPDEDGWLWTFLEARLGQTEQKEYLSPKMAPDYLELPRPP